MENVPGRKSSYNIRGGEKSGLVKCDRFLASVYEGADVNRRPFGENVGLSRKRFVVLKNCPRI